MYLDKIEVMYIAATDSSLKVAVVNWRNDGVSFPPSTLSAFCLSQCFIDYTGVASRNITR